jgi:hypothetical protein
MKKWLCVVLVAALLAGCSTKSHPSGSRVVSQITVSYQENGIKIVKNYTSQYKMRQILNQFRLLGQMYSPVIDPDTMTTQVFQVELFFSDGSQRMYQTRNDCYIRTDDGPWQQTDTARLLRLNELLLELPADIG